MLDPSRTDGCGNTALHYVVGLGLTEVALWLMEHNFNFMAGNYAGITPMDIARARGNTWLIRHFEKKYAPAYLMGHAYGDFEI